MKRVLAISVLLLCLFGFGGCAEKNAAEEEMQSSLPSFSATEESPDSAANTVAIKGQDNTMEEITITAAGATFHAVLYNTPTAADFLSRLPLTITMSELNGNEKYYHFAEALVTEAEEIASVEAGDLMIYQEDCLVIFYEDHTTAYHYTRLGHCENGETLAAALGNGNVTVTFQAKES